MSQQAALAYTMENFKFAFDKALEGLFIDRVDQNEAIFARYMNDNEFQQVVANFLLRQVYNQIHGENEQQAAGASASQANV